MALYHNSRAAKVRYIDDVDVKKPSWRECALDRGRTVTYETGRDYLASYGNSYLVGDRNGLSQFILLTPKFHVLIEERSFEAMNPEFTGIVQVEEDNNTGQGTSRRLSKISTSVECGVGNHLLLLR